MSRWWIKTNLLIFIDFYWISLIWEGLGRLYIDFQLIFIDFHWISLMFISIHFFIDFHWISSMPTTMENSLRPCVVQVMAALWRWIGICNYLKRFAQSAGPGSSRIAILRPQRHHFWVPWNHFWSTLATFFALRNASECQRCPRSAQPRNKVTFGGSFWSSFSQLSVKKTLQGQFPMDLLTHALFYWFSFDFRTPWKAKK